MSIIFSVGPNGATTGRKDQTIDGDGPIDKKAEAEAALSFLPEGSTDTVLVNGREYTRAQLIEIRDQPAALSSEATPPPATSGETTSNSGISHSIGLGGNGSYGLGEYGHSGGGGTVGYKAGIPLSGDRYLTLGGGVNVGHSSLGFSTPGGESANSAFTNYGGYISGGIDQRFGKLSVGGALKIGVNAFSTAPSKLVSTPPMCTPGDLGREECEPQAGPRTGNAGTQGLLNPDADNARGTSGAAVTAGADLIVSGKVFSGDSGTLSLYGSVGPEYTQLLPSAGHGFGYFGVKGGAGVEYTFGGSSKVESRPELVVDAPVDNTENTDLEKVKGATITPTGPAEGDPSKVKITLDDKQIRDLAGLPSDADILGIQLDGGPENTKKPFEFTLTPGKHDLVIRYQTVESAKDKNGNVIRDKNGNPVMLRIEHLRPVRIIVEPRSVDATKDETGRLIIAGGYSLQYVPNVERPTAPTTSEGTPISVKVGTLRIPEGARIPSDTIVEIRVGTRVNKISIAPTTGSSRELSPRDVKLEIPAAWLTAKEDPIGETMAVTTLVRLGKGPGSQIHRYGTTDVRVGPSTRIGTPPAKMGADSYVNTRAMKGILPTALINVVGKEPLPQVTVKVNNHVYEITDTATLTPNAQGVVTIPLRNPGLAMQNDLVGATRGTYPVTLTIKGEKDPINLTLTIGRGTYVPSGNPPPKGIPLPPRR